MARDIAYQIKNSLAGTNDGSGMVIHTMDQVWREDTAQPEDPWFVIAGYSNKGVAIHWSEVKAVMDLGTQQAIIQAYKAMLDLHVGNGQLVPAPKDWGNEEEINKQMDDNEASVLQAGRVNTFVTVNLGETFPVQFELSL